MSWVEILDNHQFLKSLFPLADPSLDVVHLHEIKMHQEGPVVSLRFDLSEYPAQPPEKWQIKNSNIVQVCLMGIGVRDLLIRGWTSNNIGRLRIESRTKSVGVDLDTGGCRIAATFDHLRVDSVTGYRDEVPH